MNTMLSIRIATLILFLALVESKTIQEDGTVKHGKFRYTYDDSITDNCESVVMIGVGTAMRNEDYDILAERISRGQPIVTVIFDHNPGNIVKYGAKDYANFYKRFVPNIGELLPACKGGETAPKIIMGGHSGSGRGGYQAMMIDDNDDEKVNPDGFVGLDPFQVTERTIWGIGPSYAPATIIDPDLPTLSWGFECVTCGVTVAIAGREAYELSSSKHRVFYRVQNANHTKSIGHCEFTDKGCGPLPRCPKPNSNSDDDNNDKIGIKDIIARSIQVFCNGVVQGSIHPYYFGFDTSNDEIEIDVFINGDEIA